MEVVKVMLNEKIHRFTTHACRRGVHIFTDSKIMCESSLRYVVVQINRILVLDISYCSYHLSWLFVINWFAIRMQGPISEITPASPASS